MMFPALLTTALLLLSPFSSAAFSPPSLSPRTRHSPQQALISRSVEEVRNKRLASTTNRRRRSMCRRPSFTPSSLREQSSSGGGGGGGGGDKLRASTGIRPSLHPTTINAISEALLLRSSSKKKQEDQPVDVWADGVEPLSVALTAGKIASDALEKRTVSCRADGDEDSIPTPEECQAVAGRVVGVVMRLRDLEEDLATKAGSVGWVKKYNEYGTFGVLKSECKAAADEEGEREVGENGISVRSVDSEREAELSDRIRDDPLFRMCRAECLLAIFIQNVEIPQLEQAGQDVAGGSAIDFIDEDRKEVLLSFS